ncbi:WD40-repeat-containing domain protein [Ephemerocybe angulata]|uniref:DNA damage-binding protein CMR1 n=1 Tax=Ephemerocybe angulata TaxID=980116 RepID=A0A8H6IIT9_9AGAR|nr:WD40-repeat-containing domain protein [Tulosesus angulatus]
MPKLSAYELEREANIARNKALLQELELKQAVASLPTKAKAKAAAKPIQPAKREKRKREPEAEQPRRKSARLRKGAIDPDETPEERIKREREEEEEGQREEENRLREEEAKRIAHRPRHNKLDMVALIENGPAEIETLTKAFEAVPKSSVERTGDFDAYAFEDSKEDERALKDLRERMSKLVVHARAKVTMNRIYCAAYHPEVTKDLIFFGDRYGQLGIWDARAPADDDEEVEEGADREGGKYWRMQLHWPANAKSSISSIKMDPIDAHNSREVFSTDSNNLVNCIDISPDGHEMWISDSQGWATQLDPREAKHRARSYALSDNKIGSISINPTRPHFIATASNSRFVKVWDVRKLSAMVAEMGDDAAATSDEERPSTIDFLGETVNEYMQSEAGKGGLRGEFLHGKSATAAYWDPRGRQIVSTSYDDTLRLWNLDGPSLDSKTAFKKFQPFSRISHNCQTGKWVSLLKATWTKNPDVYPYFTIANMNHALDIYSCKGDLVQQLADPRRITAVQAVTCSHPSIVERVATGNGSGRCVLWAPEDLE